MHKLCQGPTNYSLIRPDPEPSSPVLPATEQWVPSGAISSLLFADSYIVAPDLGFVLDNSQPDISYPRRSNLRQSAHILTDPSTDWSLLTAATIPNGSSTVRDRLIKSVYARAYVPKTRFPLPVRYKASNGEPIPGFGSGRYAIRGKP